MNRRSRSSQQVLLAHKLRSIAHLLAWSAFLIGCVTLVGWSLNIPVLIHPLKTLPTFKVNAALCTILTNLGIVLEPSMLPLRQRWYRKAAGWIATICASLIIAIAGLTLIEHGLHVDLGIDQLLMQQPEPVSSLYVPGRMPPNTAVAFLLLGIALCCKTRRLQALAQNLVFAGGSIAGIALLGYLYGNVNFRVPHTYTGMAIYAAIAVLLLNAALLFAHPEWPIMRLLCGTGAGSVIVRRLLPLAAIPILSTQIGLYGYQLGLYTPEAQDVLQSSLDFALIATLIAWAGFDLNRLDAERKQSESALRESHRKLTEAQQVAHIGSWELNAITQKINWSEETFHIFGRDPSQPEPSTDELQQQIHPDDLPAWQTYVDEMLIQGNPTEFDLRILMPDGSVRYVESRSQSVVDAQGQVIRTFGTAQDITARKSLESQLRSQFQNAHALSQVVQVIRNSLDLETIFQTAALEVGRILRAHHTVITQYLPQQQQWCNIAEYRQNTAQPSMLGLKFPDADNLFATQLRKLEVVRLDDPTQLSDQVNASNREAIQTFPGAWLMVPLSWNSSLWGSMGVVRSLGSPIQDSEVQLAQEIANQLAIAIHQSELYRQVQQLNATLEHKVVERTKLLQRAYNYEALLKRITDQVRDSLDEAQILQTAVQELASALQAICCDTGIYDLEQSISTIRCDYATTIPSVVGTVVPMSHFPEAYAALLQGQTLCFCILAGTGLSIRPQGYETAVLACPIQDDQGVWGDLWLHKPPRTEFTDLEIRLVQQVADQCAIALRQSRLYQAVQTQVAELARLNAVKDDFLGMVSHELRAPMANIKMAAQMLEITLQPLNIKDGRSQRYLNILKEECSRETNLINDLLDLSRLEMGRVELSLSEINLSLWLSHILNSFQERTVNQQQELMIDLPSELPILTTDPSYLERIMTELLHNACKYTPAGEKIIVSGQVVADYLQLCVTNTGVEITESDRDRVFEKFYRIPHNDPWKNGGTGLGLALIKKMVECLGASIQLDSSPGYVTFTLRYPLSDES